MGISIRNADLEARIRRLALERGVSLTEAMDQAVTEAIGRETAMAPPRSIEVVRKELSLLHRKYDLGRFRDEDWHKRSAALFDEHGLPR
jgi:hypothetical protein